MLSIGRFAESANVSARTVRFYESIGLLPAPSRGENNYRFYDPKWLDRMNRIRDLQSLGFSLDEIKSILNFSNIELTERLEGRLNEIENQVQSLQEQKTRIRDLLSVSNKIETGECLTEKERNLYMENIKEEIIKGLQSRYDHVPEAALSYLQRESWLEHHPQINVFLEGVKKCVAFAKQKNLVLGPARGSAPCSLSLYGLGFSSVDPLKHEMIPERLSAQSPFFHIDVEYERGQEFVDFCREINRSLPIGEIQAFKMPLIDIVQNVHKRLGKVIDYDSIDDNSDLVLSVFRNTDIEKIFQFDFSDDALVMQYESFLPDYRGLQKITEFLEQSPIQDFRDIINFTAVWRPHCQEMINRIELYQRARSKPHSYGFLSPNLERWLRPNHGVILYHEDLIKIISEVTGWNFERSNSLRRLCMSRKKLNAKEDSRDWQEFQELAPKPVVDLVAEESKWSFCLPHAIAFAKFTKQTAILKSLHKDIYFQEIEAFEQKHGFRWDDIGIRIKGVSLHQG